MPGHKIPEPYCWDESFCVFYEKIDAQHKILFDGIFACIKNPSDGAALSKLTTDVKNHFTDEEKMMQDANYSEFAAHKPLHTAFVSTLEALKTPLTAANLDYAKVWLVDHIKDTDFKYKGKL